MDKDDTEIDEFDRQISQARYSSTMPNNNYAVLALTVVQSAVDTIGRWCKRLESPFWRRASCRPKAGENPEDKETRIQAETLKYRQELTLEACYADAWLMDEVRGCRLPFCQITEALGHDHDDFLGRIYDQFDHNHIKELRLSKEYNAAIANFAPAEAESEEG